MASFLPLSFPLSSLPFLSACLSFAGFPVSFGGILCCYFRKLRSHIQAEAPSVKVGALEFARTFEPQPLKDFERRICTPTRR